MDFVIQFFNYLTTTAQGILISIATFIFIVGVIMHMAGSENGKKVMIGSLGGAVIGLFAIQIFQFLQQATGF